MTNRDKAEFAMRFAEHHFEKLGFKVKRVKDPCGTGHDLEIEKWHSPTRGSRYTVEVKMAGYSKNGWRIRNRHKRVTDDFIAIVFPSGHVHVDDMQSFMALANADGGRHLGMLGDLYKSCEVNDD